MASGPSGHENERKAKGSARKSADESNCSKKNCLPFELVHNHNKEDSMSKHIYGRSTIDHETVNVYRYQPGESNEHALAQDIISNTDQVLTAQSSIPDLWEITTCQNDALSSCQLAATKSVRSEGNHELTPKRKISLPLSTSSPLHIDQRQLITKHGESPSLHNFISPVQKNQIHHFDKDIPPNKFQKQRRRKNIYRRLRFSILNRNNNSLADSDDELDNKVPASLDYLLLKKAADFIVDRISIQKQAKQLVDIKGIIEYLQSFYLNEVTKLPGNNVQTISYYRTTVINFFKVFNPDQLTTEICLFTLLASLLTNNGSVFDACLTFAFENLYFLASCPDFLRVPPELMFLVLCSNHSVILGRNGFPMSYNESQKELGKFVRKFIRERKAENLKKAVFLENSFMLLIDPKSSINCTDQLKESKKLPFCKRLYHEIQYHSSRKFISTQNTHEYHVQTNILSAVSIINRSDDQEQKPGLTPCPQNKIKDICNVGHTLRKIYFTYVWFNKVPYITFIGLQYVWHGRKVIFSIGRASNNCRSIGQQSSETVNKLLNDCTERLTSSTAGLPSNDSAGRPSNDSAGRPSNDSAGRPSNDSAGRPSNDSAGRPSKDSAGRPSNDSAGRPSNDSAEKPSNDSARRSSSDSAGRPSRDTANKLLNDCTERLTNDSTGRLSCGSVLRPSSGSVRQPSSDTANKQLNYSTEKLIVDSTGQPSNDTANKLLNYSTERLTSNNAGRPSCHTSNKLLNVSVGRFTSDTAFRPSNDLTHKLYSNSPERLSTDSQARLASESQARLSSDPPERLSSYSLARLSSDSTEFSDPLRLQSTPKNSFINSIQHCKLKTTKNIDTPSKKTPHSFIDIQPKKTAHSLPQSKCETSPSAPVAATPSGKATIEDDYIISQDTGISKMKMTAVKLAKGEHFTGVSVQGSSVLHNIMVHTNKGRHVRAHGIEDFPSSSSWTEIPPPGKARFCLQAISADSYATACFSQTYIQNLRVIWMVLSDSMNNLSG